MSPENEVARDHGDVVLAQDAQRQVVFPTTSGNLVRYQSSTEPSRSIASRWRSAFKSAGSPEERQGFGLNVVEAVQKARSEVAGSPLPLNPAHLCHLVARKRCGHPVGPAPARARQYRSDRRHLRPCPARASRGRGRGSGSLRPSVGISPPLFQQNSYYLTLLPKRVASLMAIVLLTVFIGDLNPESHYLRRRS